MELNEELPEHDAKTIPEHLWPIRQQWINEQFELKKQLILQDDFDWEISDLEHEITKPPLKRIGGVDISFIKDNEVNACASLVVLSFPEFEVIYSRFEMVELKLPYMSGFLAFREVPFLLKLVEDLKQNHPELFPQLIMVDGNGSYHQRGFGLACHLGVLANIPTIGCGKTYLNVDGITFQQIKEWEKTLSKGGEHHALIGQSGTVWGALFRATSTSSKAIFISPGHRISLETTIKIVKLSCSYRIPEPVRQADLMSREYIRKHPLQE